MKTGDKVIIAHGGRGGRGGFGVWYISGEFLLYNDFWHKLDETPIEDKECLLLLRFHKKVFSKLTNVKSGKFYYRDGEPVPVNFILAWGYVPELPSWIEE